MSRYDIYILVLCIIVFVLLTVILTILIGYVVKLLLRSIRSGAEDERIKIEYFKAKKKKQSKALSIADKAFSGVVFLLFFTLFLCSMFVNVSSSNSVGEIPRLQVVSSSSMSKKLKSNTYLYQHNLNDQFDTFDVILTHQLPAEKDLKLYDIVVYEVDELLIVHRIVGIEEPNDKHPNERHFLLQGDNVENPDRFPVRYSQMKGIYRGQRAPFVGSLVMFMRSPAGILCVLLIVFAMVATPIVNKRLLKARAMRVREILEKLAKEKQAQEAGVPTAETTRTTIMPSAQATATQTAVDVEKADKTVVAEAPAEGKPKRARKTRKEKALEQPIAHVVLRTENEELSKLLQGLGLTTENGIYTGDMGFVNAMRAGEELNVKLKTDAKAKEQE